MASVVLVNCFSRRQSVVVGFFKIPFHKCGRAFGAAEREKCQLKGESKCQSLQTDAERTASPFRDAPL